MTDLTPLPANEEPLPYTPTAFIAFRCQALFGCHPDKRMQVRAGQVVALWGIVEAVRKLLALSALPEPETDEERTEGEELAAEIQAELGTWMVGFDDELRREMHPRPRLVLPDPPVLVRPT